MWRYRQTGPAPAGACHPECGEYFFPPGSARWDSRENETDLRDRRIQLSLNFAYDNRIDIRAPRKEIACHLIFFLKSINTGKDMNCQRETT